MKLTKNTINHLILIAVFAVSFITILVLATFFDLKLNTAVYNPTGFFGQVFSNIGEIPTYFALPVIAIIFYQSVTAEDKHFLLIKIVMGIFLIGTTYVLINNIFSNLAAGLLYQPAYIAFFTALVSVFSILGTNHIDKKLLRKLCVFALFLLVVAALSQGIVWIAKHSFQRMRFRNMTDGQGFTPWYVFNAGIEGREALIAAGSVDVADAFRSFPSGHTANSAILFCLLFLPNIFPRMKRFRPAFFIGAAVWTILVASARIAVGAHFLSDVLVGGSITITVTALTKWTFEYFYRKKGKSMAYDSPSAGDAVIISIGDLDAANAKTAAPEDPAEKVEKD